MGDRDLVGAAAHIAYEWLSVAEMSALLSGIVGSRTSAENAFLESGLVHYRCIVNFVCGDYKGRWRPGDIKPEDFLDRPWWPADEEFDRRLRGRLPGVVRQLDGTTRAPVAWDHFIGVSTSAAG